MTDEMGEPKRFAWQRSYDPADSAAAFVPRLTCWDTKATPVRRTDVSIIYRLRSDREPPPGEPQSFTPTFELYLDSALIARSNSLDQLRDYGAALARWMDDFEL